MYDPEGKRVYVSQDVKFEEDKPWPWNSQSAGGTDMTDTFSVLETNAEVQAVVDTEVMTDSDMGSPNSPYTNSNLGSSNSPYTEVTTPQQTQTPAVNPDNYDGSTEPKRFRKLEEVYAETEEMQVEEELYFVGADEPENYKCAAKD